MYKNSGEVVNSFPKVCVYVVSHLLQVNATSSGYCLHSSKKKLEMFHIYFIFWYQEERYIYIFLHHYGVIWIISSK